jgi:hypothetical protein
MADKKITQLTALTGATTAADDPLVIVDLSTNETKKINASELFKAVPAGSAAAPAIVAQGDQNTGIYFPAADTIGFVEGGVEAMRIDNAGNVLAMTSNLYLNANGTYLYSKTVGGSAVRMIGINPSDTAYVGPIDPGPTSAVFNASSTSTIAAFYTGATEKMRIDSAGNLGLGVTPGAWESTAKAIQFGTLGYVARGSSGQTILGYNNFINTSNQYVYLATTQASRYEQVSGEHRWFSAPSGTAGTVITFTETMRVDPNGNVGIGTLTPSTFGKLAVAGNTVPTVTNSYSLGTSTYKWSNVHATTFTENGFNVVSQTDLGSNPNEVPLNQYLGQLAYQDQLGLFNNLNTAPTVLSASTIQPVSPIQFVSGTTAIVNITVPPEFAVGGGQLTLIPTGLWTTTTAGNIALATTAVVNRAVTMFYDAATTKWYPSY